MSYNTDLPPVIVRTGDTTWELRDSTGSVIATYDQIQFRSPDDWWSDLITYIRNNLSGNTKVEDAVADLTLLIIKEDWNMVDER